MVHRRAGGAQRVDEVDLAAAVGGQVFHQQHALAFGQQTFDLRVTAETLRLLAHVLHRHHQAVGQPCRERDAGGFATGHRVDLLIADVAQDGGFSHFHQATAHARIRDQLAAVDINRARPAGRENVRFVRVEVHCLHFQQHLGGGVGDRLAIEACHGRILGCERGEAGAGPGGAASGVCRAMMGGIRSRSVECGPVFATRVGRHFTRNGPSRGGRRACLPRMTVITAALNGACEVRSGMVCRCFPGCFWVCFLVRL